MKQKSLFLLCGVPGSGKTTWVRNQLTKTNIPSIHISRDEIRFSILKEDEEYFSHETEVFDTFCNQIQKALNTDNDCIVYADATHLNEKSRNKVLDKLNLDNIDIYAVNFDLPVDICLNQNEERKGNSRTYVPRNVIRRMYTQYVPPTEKEKYKYKRILNIR